MSTALLEQQETETVEQSNTLNATHRCDRLHCSAAAYVDVKLNNGNLLFCGHHFNKIEGPLRSAAIKVVDERWKLTWNRHKGTANS